MVTRKSAMVDDMVIDDMYLLLLWNMQGGGIIVVVKLINAYYGWQACMPCFAMFITMYVPIIIWYIAA